MNLDIPVVITGAILQGLLAGEQIELEGVVLVPGDDLFGIVHNESQKMATDDRVVERYYTSVPKDMKCHKCGAPEPWCDDINRHVGSR